MFRVIICLLLMGAFGGCKRGEDKSSPAKGPGKGDKAEATLKLFDQFEKKVWSELLQSLTEHKTAEAVAVCQEVSRALTVEFAELPGVKVRRIGTRARNPAHKPDEFERNVLKEWQKALDQRLEPQAVIEETSNGLRVMRPIIVGKKTCLRCHGKLREILPETLARIREVYPEDEATGYEVGDLRGAFTAIWPK